MRISIPSPYLIATILLLSLIVPFSITWLILENIPVDYWQRNFIYLSVGTAWLAAIIVFALSRPFTSSAHTAAQAEEQAAAQTLFLELYRNSPIPYLRITRQGEIISVNNATLRLFQVSSHVLDEQNAFDLLQFSDENRRSVLIAEIARGVFINDIEVSLTDDSGAKHWLLLSCFPIGNRHERLITLFDMTKQKEVDMAKSEFLSLASHQLRTPISAIKWNLELLMTDKSQNITAEQQTFLEKISRNTEKMKTLVQDFLDASQLDMGSFAGTPVDIEVNQWLGQICEEFADRIAEKSINLRTTFPPETCTIHTDEHLLHNALSNLISNAIKYTPAEGDVNVQYTTTATAITFTISDTGIGIPEAEQAKLFNKFFRASNAQENNTEGTGLGLYIAKRAIDEIGGTVTVASKVGAGTSFVVTIPRSQKS